MAIYKRDGFDSGVTEDKSNQWSERDLNPGQPHSNPTPRPLSHAASVIFKSLRNFQVTVKETKRGLYDKFSEQILTGRGYYIKQGGKIFTGKECFKKKLFLAMTTAAESNINDR